MERFGLPSYRGISVRSILTFVLAVIITALLWVVIGGHTAQALGATDASWGGDAIIFDGHSFGKTTDLKDPTNTVPSDATVYQAPVQTGMGGDKKALVIYFSSGVDPPTATTAQYVEFNQSSAGVLSNPGNQKTIKLTIKGEEAPIQSCSVEGIGWMICPVSLFLASGMDWIFGLLAGFIAVQPAVLGDSNNSMYVAWNIMRNIANVAFVIVFLIIIYSQLTNFGVSNYGLKKLMPRLIVAAILVNVSFIVAAIAIDVSNILGYSVQSVFNTIRENVFHLTNDNFAGANSWTAVTGIILAGGGYIGATYFISAGGPILLVPLLLGLLLTVMIVVIVLAARQAIIVILVIIAPLAFVANLLPNTEKWFDKWKDLFFTMLVFFPAFSLVFGGSQLAGQIIIQNAGSNIIMVLFGLAVQIAPLVITPLLFKLSGNLLGKIAQIANNPNKGILDRSKAWAGTKADMKKQQTLSSKQPWWNAGGKLLQNSDTDARKTRSRTEIYKLRADNKYHASKDYGDLHEGMAGAELDKDTIQNRNAEHIEHLKVARGSSLYDRTITTQASKENLDAATNRTSEHLNDLRVASGNPLNRSFNNLEASKATLETSESTKSAYLNQQRMLAGSALNRTVEPLEASKLHADSVQSQYTNMVDKMKLDPNSRMYRVAQDAQSSKEHLEATQSKVQALFDSQRRTEGTSLHRSTTDLDTSKLAAEESKSLTTTFFNDQKSTIGTDLHIGTVNAERAKLGAQLSESRVTKVIEEYKSGALNDPAMTPELQAIMESMKEDNARVAAEKQGATSAQYEQQKYISSLMDENAVGPLAAEVLQTAAGVDPNGRTRARANAISQLKKLEGEAITNNVTLLNDQAEKEGTTLKALSKLIFARHTGEDLPAGETQAAQDPSIVEAAMEALAQDGDVSTLRKARMNPDIDQSMLTRVFSRNSGNMKAKGGFDLQANPGLANATREEMDISIAGTLGDIAAGNIAGQKAGWWADLSNDLPRIFNNVENFAYDPDPIKNAEKKGAQKATLKQTYHNLTTALTNPEVLKDIGDRIEQTIKMHEYLHSEFGESAMVVDYNLARQGKS